MVIVIMGPSGAGKSTVATALAADLGWIVIDADDLHSSDSRARMSRGEGMTDEHRGPWLLAVRAEIDSALSSGRSTVLACSALKAEHRKVLGTHRDGVRVVYLRADRATLERRLRTRLAHFAGVSLLDTQLAALEEPQQAFYVDATQPLEDVLARIRAQLPEKSLELGMIGLGRMGANMVRRLLRGGHRCVVYDQSPAAIAALAEQGASGAATLDAFISQLATPRIVWMMVPAGAATEATVNELMTRLSAGDLLIDGGNSWFKDDVRRAALLKAKGISYVDVGTSGGIWGLDRGYCLMVGGDAESFARIEPIFKTLAPGRGDIAPSQGRERRNATVDHGYLHCGPVGAGHFVKMVHNGIEYGLMQAFAEGFDILRGANTGTLPAEHRYDLELADIAELWRRGSVVSSWLLDLTAAALAEDPQLASYEGFVPDSGEGRWTVQAALEEAVPADVISASLFARFRSRQQHTFAEKVLSAMRAKFGGHVEKPK